MSKGKKKRNNHFKDKKAIKNNCQKSHDRLTMMMRNIVELGKYSFELEQKREESISEQSSKMLNALSLFAAVFYTLTAILFDKEGLPSAYLNIVVTTITLCLSGSVLLLVFSQWRYKYYQMKNINYIFKEVSSNQEDYKEDYQFYYQWKYQLGTMHEKLKRNNDIRVVFLMISMSLFVLTIILMGIFCVWFFR